jgi:SAM-dependent methyltransferase
MTEQPEDPHYTLPNDWELAQQRLDLLGASFDAPSIELALRLGVTQGTRCLEAGAGGGSFARWLCTTVIPRGRVLAVDADPRHLDDLPARGGEVCALDLVNDDLGHGQFDFVHTRLVLLHIHERDRVLDRLARALAPGGVLMIEEHDVFGTLEAMTGAYGELWAVFHRMSQAAGLDATWARTLPRRLASLGLTDVHASGGIEMFRGGDPMARLWSLTWLQAREQLIAAGGAPELIDAARAELEDPDRWFHCPAMVRATAKRPELS